MCMCCYLSRRIQRGQSFLIPSSRNSLLKGLVVTRTARFLGGNFVKKTSRKTNNCQGWIQGGLRGGGGGGGGGGGDCL